MSRTAGALNKRSSGLLAKLKEDYDLDPLLKLAELCSMEVPIVLPDGNPMVDDDGKPYMRPYLDPNAMVTALGKLGDKTYPTLKAAEVQMSMLPTAVVDMTGVRELENDGELIEQVPVMDEQTILALPAPGDDDDPSQDAIAQVLGTRIDG